MRKGRPRTVAKKTTKSGDARSRWPPSKVRLEQLLQEALVDAYGDSEQRVALFTMIEDHLALPFETEVLDATVMVERVTLNEAEEIVAICRRNKRRQAVPILDLPLPEPLPRGAEWIEAYRTWARGL